MSALECPHFDLLVAAQHLEGGEPHHCPSIDVFRRRSRGPEKPISLSYDRIDEIGFSYPIKESPSFPQHPPPFGQLYFSFFQCFVAIIQGSYSLL